MYVTNELGIINTIESLKYLLLMLSIAKDAAMFETRNDSVNLRIHERKKSGVQ